MRQFDVIVLEENSPQFDNWTPPFEDPALGWLHDYDWNRPLQSIDAEWVVITQPAVKIDREFLNNLAEVTEGFPGDDVTCGLDYRHRAVLVDFPVQDDTTDDTE